MKACDCRLLKPQRMLKLAFGAEAFRCKLTWQMLDRRIWDFAFGGTEVLKKYFVKPEDAIGNLEHAVIGFSDQVPWWGMMKQGKQLYMKHEHNKAAAKTAGEPSQKRGWDDDQASKLRIVVELRQIVKGWSGSGVPTGELADSLVIVPGVHARLSNASDDGRWIKAERFQTGKKTVVRIQGRKVGPIMQFGKDLRKKWPELFDGITLVQRPAAVMGTILSYWVLEEHGDVPSVHLATGCIGRWRLL